MTQHQIQDITQAVLARLGDDVDPRFSEIIGAVVRHAHALVREVDLKPDEWIAGDRVPHRARQDLRRQAAGVHPAVGHAGHLDAGRRAGAGARGAAGAARPPARGRPRPRCRARSTGTARPSCRWAATSAKACRASRRSTAAASPTLDGRPIAARCSTSGRATATACTTCSAARAGMRAARALPHRRRGPLLVLVDPADLLPGARRRPGRRHAARDGPRIRTGRATST